MHRGKGLLTSKLVSVHNMMWFMNNKDKYAPIDTFICTGMCAYMSMFINYGISNSVGPILIYGGWRY